MNKNFTRFAFTDSVRAVQEEYGSRKAYAKAETNGDRYRLTSREIQFIENSDGFYLSTVGENGWPYIQFRGGPKGFLKVLDNETLAMADFSGNRQYISTGNIKSMGKAMLFFMDYAKQSRLKVWTEAEVIDVDANPELLETVSLFGYKARIERIIRYRIQAYDWNCQQHITPRYTIPEIKQMITNESNSQFIN
ncbi:pyridoxamine 5'-phosphate oxidase family protein [Rubellicoccus peritrichatus]|uniref:Pyridoxamine 5'-phosphate oxidase family protein n=1 Tax=Rubellicoccus peritrichatus TaxID=3080537 RepID=A0AAQ3LB21_9BACT|nr:pyridoxamine 5'-phosphate oxidase family protein [Puniceicoccus sp. CR14]WOO40987.1 pyridoxamine 5'-phosphate oxidase family protein [Puniceicoccus sp. CR14]